MCTVGGCDRPALADGMCGTHFQRWWKRDCDHYHRAWQDDDDEHDPPIPTGLLEAVDARLTALREGDGDGAVRRLWDVIATTAGRNASPSASSSSAPPRYSRCTC